MSKNFFTFIILTILCCTLMSCEDKDVSTIVLYTDIDKYIIDAKSSDTITYELNIVGNKSNISRIVVKEYIPNRVIRKIIDSIVDAPKLKYDLTYIVPQITDSISNITLKIEVTDKQGNSDIFPFNIHVKGNIPLTETIKQFYGYHSGRENGYCFATRTWIKSSISPDSITDWYDTYTTDSLSLSKEWHSKTNKYFARVTGLEFAKINRSSAISSYKSATKSFSISDIKTGDIIFIGRNDQQPLAVTYVTSIANNPNSIDDHYLLRIKFLD